MYNKNIFELSIKKKLILSLLGVIFLIFAFFIALSSWTFNFEETGWRVLSNVENQNFFGKFGSYVSGFLLKEFGILAPIFLFLILTLYGFKFLKHQTISKLWLKSILLLGLILLLGMLQPLHKILSIYLFDENKILKYEGFSTNFYKFILAEVNHVLNLGKTFSYILTNITITLLSILIFIYTASTNISELSFLKKLIAPFYLPVYWLVQLFNNLFIKKSYLNTNQDGFVQKKQITL